MKRPRKAFLLAAGLGTRMRPLSNGTPKALMPLWGKPVIDHVIDLLSDWGVRDILINLHHAPSAIVEHLRGRSSGVRLNFSFEPEILGTGGALARAGWFFDAAPFWVVNTDIAADLSPSPFLREFERSHPLAVLWMDPHKGPRTVELCEGRVTDFRSESPGLPDTYTFCGLHLVNPEIFRFLKGARFHSIVEAYEAGLAAGRSVAGVVPSGSYWSDLGSPADYIDAHRDILRAWRGKKAGTRLMNPGMLRRVGKARSAGARCKGFTAIGHGVRIKPGAEIEDSVIWQDAVVGPRAVLQRSIVGSNVHVSSRVTGVAVRAQDYNRTPAFRRLLDELEFEFEQTTVCPLPPRGSNRSFTRLVCGRRTGILVRYNMARPENGRFAGHARFLLKAGIPVPRVLVDMPRERMVVMEDVGNRSLEDAIGDLSVRQIERHYRRVLDGLLRMHAISSRRLKSEGIRLEPAFSARVYRWERELMGKHLLRDRLGMSPGAIGGILTDIIAVTGELVHAPKVLVHRDMQSSNILLRRGGPVFLDFQGMRMGPAAYDVASLLCDPYVMLPQALQDRLLDYYLDRCAKPERVAATYRAAALQRLTQALGAYGRLSAMPGMSHFEKYIPAALEMFTRICCLAEDAA